MKLRFDDESRARAVRSGMRAGGICRSAAYCSLLYGHTGYYGSGIDSGFILLTDYSLRMVTMNIYNTYQVKDTFDIPYFKINNISLHKGLYGRWIVKFKLNDCKYKLLLYKYSHITCQKENIDVVAQFFANLKNMQQAS